MFIHFFKYEMDNQDIIQNIILLIDCIDDLKSLRMVNRFICYQMNLKYIIGLLCDKFHTFKQEIINHLFQNIGQLIPIDNKYLKPSQCLGQYFTFNGDFDIYKVIVEENQVSVYYRNSYINKFEDTVEDISCLYTQWIGDYNTQGLFLRQYNGYQDIGTTFLLHINELNYIYIGHVMYSFTAIAKIVNYGSPLNSHDDFNPYAIDEYNNFYLLADTKFIKMDNQLKVNISEYDNPCDYYYDYYYNQYDTFYAYNELKYLNHLPDMIVKFIHIP
jgi:hypothetical protein